MPSPGARVSRLPVTCCVWPKLDGENRSPKRGVLNCTYHVVPQTFWVLSGLMMRSFSFRSVYGVRYTPSLASLAVAIGPRRAVSRTYGQ